VSARVTDASPDALAQRALGDGERPRLAGRLSASITYAWRVLLKIKHVPEELGDAVGIPLLFTVLFTYLFGGALEGSTHTYLQHLLPGTIVLAVVFLTVYSGVNLNRDLTTGAFDRFRSLPVWRPAPLVGSLLGDVGRYLLAVLLVLVLGFIMGFDAGGGVLGVLAGIALAIVFALSLSWAWLALGLVLRSPSAVMSIGFVILMPLAFMSNIFVDVNTLPGWLETFTEINPITHVVTAERGLIHGHVQGSQLGWALLATAGLTAIFMPLALYLQGRRP
jgi:daunorubicin/doxorubicin transport system permease protein